MLDVAPSGHEGIPSLMPGCRLSLLPTHVSAIQGSRYRRIEAFEGQIVHRRHTAAKDSGRMARQRSLVGRCVRPGQTRGVLARSLADACARDKRRQGRPAPMGWADRTPGGPRVPW
jgi:hypothetical protein